MNSRYQNMTEKELLKKAKGGLLSKADKAAQDELDRRKRAAEEQKLHSEKVRIHLLAEYTTKEGVRLFNTGNIGGALEKFESCLQLTPHSHNYNNKGYVLYIMNKHEQALECFESALNLLPDSVLYNHPTLQDDLSICAYFGKIDTLIVLKRYKEVLTISDDILREEKESIKARISKAYALNKLGSYKESLQILHSVEKDRIENNTKYLKNVTDKWTAIDNATQNNVYSAERKSAYKEYNTAKNKLDYLLMMCELAIGDASMGIKDYDKAVNIYTYVENCCAMFIKAYGNKKNGGSEFSLSHYPDPLIINAINISNTSDNINPLGDMDIYYFTKRISIDAKMRKGFATFKLEKFHLAYDIFDEVLKLDPKNGEATKYKALCSEQKKILDDKLKAETANKLKLLEEKNAENQKINNITKNALAKLESDDFLGAIKEYDLLVSLQPKNADAFRYRGLAKSKLEQHPGAISDLERAIELKHGDYPAAVSLLDILKRKISTSTLDKNISSRASSHSITKALQSNSKQTFSIIPYDHLAFTGKELGEGGFGVVKQAKWQHIDVAVKQLKLSKLNATSLEEFKQEAERHGALRHPNIVTLYGVCLEPSKYSMVMELMVSASLYDLLHNNSELPWKLRLQIATDIIVGLSYLHAQNIIHRDLKSLNVLLDDKLRAKLSDFGLSQVKSESASTSTAASVGTLCWMAPELLARNGKCTAESDVYALAIVLWELASRKLPFSDAANQAIVAQWIRDGERENIPADSPSEYAPLIRRCWAQRSEERPSMKTIVDEIFKINNEYEEKNPNKKNSGYQVFSQ